MVGVRTLFHVLAVALVLVAIGFGASQARAHEGRHAHGRSPAPEAAHFAGELAPRPEAHPPAPAFVAQALVDLRPAAPASDCRNGCCAAGSTCCHALVAPPRDALLPPPGGRSVAPAEPRDVPGYAPEIRPKPPRRDI